jgi:hypothetical protein
MYEFSGSQWVNAQNSENKYTEIFCSGCHLCYSIVCGQKPTRIYCLGEVQHEKIDVSPYISWRGYCLKRV